MDVVGYLALGVLLLAGCIAVVGSTLLFVFRHRRTFSHWAAPDLCGPLGLQRTGVDSYTGMRGGLPVHLGYRRKRVFVGLGSGGARYPFWAEVAVHPPLALGLHITSRDGPGGAPLGWPEFDARYVVASPGIELARRLLRPEWVGRFLAVAAVGGIQVMDDRIRFDAGESWTDPARVGWIMDELVALSRHLSACRSAM